MNKTYLIILFLVIVIVFCIAGYCFVKQSNKNVIENFYNTTPVTSINVATIDVDSSTTHYKLNLTTNFSEADGVTYQDIILPINGDNTKICSLFDCNTSQDVIFNENPIIKIKKILLNSSQDGVDLEVNEVDGVTKTSINIETIVPDKNIYGYDTASEIPDPKSNIFLFYENIDSSHLKVTVELLEEEVANNIIILKKSILIEGGDIIINENNNTYIHIIYLQNNYESEEQQQEQQQQSESTEQVCEFTNKKLQDLYENESQQVKTLSFTDLCNTSECNAVVPKDFEKNHLYSTCLKEDDITEGQCNFEGDDLTMLINDDTINNCSYDKSCMLSFNTETEKFKCEKFDSNPQNVQNKEYLIVAHIDSATVPTEGIELELDSGMKDEIIKILNANDSNTIKLKDLLDSENMFFTTNFIFYSNSNEKYQYSEVDTDNILFQLSD